MQGREGEPRRRGPLLSTSASSLSLFFFRTLFLLPSPLRCRLLSPCRSVLLDLALSLIPQQSARAFHRTMWSVLLGSVLPETGKREKGEREKGETGTMTPLHIYAFISYATSKRNGSLPSLKLCSRQVFTRRDNRLYTTHQSHSLQEPHLRTVRNCLFQLFEAKQTPRDREVSYIHFWFLKPLYQCMLRSNK